MHQPCWRVFWLFSMILMVGGLPCMAERISEIPAGYSLQYYDDCGVAGRQPHVRRAENYLFPKNQLNADERARSVVFASPGVEVVYSDLQPSGDYIVGVTYASEAGNPRTQSLSADGVDLHGPEPLPDGVAEQRFYRLPAGLVADGSLNLYFELSQGHNAVVSEVELWADLPEPQVLYISTTTGFNRVLPGLVLNLRYLPQANVPVSLFLLGQSEPLASTTTDHNGLFEFDTQLVEGIPADSTLEVVVLLSGWSNRKAIQINQWLFTPPLYRPIPDSIGEQVQTEFLLDGIWRFMPTNLTDIDQVDLSSEGWADFHVPGQWLQQGWVLEDGQVNTLATQFEVPADWQNARTILRFDAVHGAATYWLNGNKFGASNHLFTPVEFDVTDFVLPEQSNILIVKLSMDYDETSERLAHASRYAHHDLGGIPRTVRVFAVPATCISRCFIQSDYDYTQHQGLLGLQIDLEGTETDQNAQFELQLSLLNPDGQPVELEQSLFSLNFDSRSAVSLTISSVQPWTAETPNLYQLGVRLLKNQIEVEKFERSIGFRRIEICGTEICLNGRRIKLAGGNRHEIDPLHGRANTAVFAATDAMLFKQANLNYVRTAHYPPTREFLEACDRIGLYVEVEAPFVWTRQWGEEGDPQYLPYFLRPTSAMVEYHHHHASVIFWSLANESGHVWGSENRLPANYVSTNRWCQTADPSRPTLFNNEWALDGGECDVAIGHYPSANFEEIAYVQDSTRPVIFDEHLHNICYAVETLIHDPGVREEWAMEKVRFGAPGLGNHWSDQSTWNRIQASSKASGLAIWAAIDDQFFLPDGSIVGYGPWGFIDGWRRKKPEWWLTKCMFSPVWIPSRQVTLSEENQRAIIPLENRFSFRNLSGLNCLWQLGSLSGSATLPDLQPGQQGTMAVDFGTTVDPAQTLILQFFNPDQSLLASYGLDLAPPLFPSPEKEMKGLPAYQVLPTSIQIQTDTFQFEIDRLTARISGSVRGEAFPLISFPRLHLTQMERKTRFSPSSSPYLELPELSTRLIGNVTAVPEQDAIKIVVQDQFEGFSGTTSWLIDRTGQGVIEFEYSYQGVNREIREVGVLIEMQGDNQTLRWRRRGVWGVYPEDHIARLDGVAQALRSTALGASTNLQQPSWDWRWDQNDFGTNDFRSSKFNVIQAALHNQQFVGLEINAEADCHVRARLDNPNVRFYLLVDNPPALQESTNLSGRFHGRLLTGKEVSSWILK